MGTTADKLAKLTATKSSLKSAINGSGSVVGDVFSEYPTAITNGKSAIAAAITNKGVQTAADATFQTMAENVGKIETGSQIETVTITNNTATAVYINVYTEYGVTPARISQGSRSDVIKNSIFIYGSETLGPSISGNYEDIGFFNYGFGTLPTYRINGDCTISGRDM